MTHPPNPSQSRDFKDLDNGLQYKDAKVGAGRAASEGDRVVFDWEGYTIGKKREAVFVGAARQGLGWWAVAPPGLYKRGAGTSRGGCFSPKSLTMSAHFAHSPLWPMLARQNPRLTVT